MEFHVFESVEKACRAAGIVLASRILEKPDCVLGLATGSTPIPAYETLVELYQNGLIDFSRVRSFNLDEYIGIDYENPLSYHAFMKENLFSKVNIKMGNVHLPDGNMDGADYDAEIRREGGIDIQLLGIGRNGHIGFNEPGTDFTYGTHIVSLTEDTIEANARFFESPQDVPREAISMGIGSIMEAKRVILIATGAAKAEAVYKTVCGPVTPMVPASILQLHPCCMIFADAAAAALMK